MLSLVARTPDPYLARVKIDKWTTEERLKTFCTINRVAKQPTKKRDSLPDWDEVVSQSNYNLHFPDGK